MIATFHPGRFFVAAVCLMTAAGATLAYDFDPRGRHFAPPAQAKPDRAGTYDLAKARLTTKVVGHVRSHYVDPTRVDPKRMVAQALVAVESAVPEVLVDVKRTRKGAPTSVSVTIGEREETYGLDRVGDLYELTWKLMDVFDFLERELPPSRDLEALEQAAVGGLLATLDPHSVLLPPRVYREMQLGTQGKFGGLGIVISVRDGSLTVMSVMTGTPADRAGLLSGDKVVQIGEESTINMPLSEAVNRMRGEPGTTVTLFVAREGHAEPLEFAIVREEIRVRSVDHHDLGDGIGYVRIHGFQSTTAADLDDALGALGAGPDGRGLEGLVLDLRENPGGLLEQAIAVADRFLSDGPIVTTVREGARERDERHARRAETLERLPIVVLVNRGSASASEIVAGALKRNGRALVVGTTTFGKGSVQVLYTIDDAALKLTIAQYLTPGDVSIQGVGIVPDLEVITLRADEGSLDLRPGELDAKGEAGLDSHLESAQTTRDKPSVQLRVLGTEGDAAGARRSRYDDFQPDTLVTLAKDVLKAAPVPERDKALVQAAGLLRERQAAEEAQLARALAARDVDWSAATGGKGAQAGARDLHVALEITPLDAEGQPGAGPWTAGTKATVAATVTNKGRRPVHQLHGVLTSEIAAVDGEELVFGRLGAGESRTETLEVELPRSLSARADAVRLALWRGQEALEGVRGGELVTRVEALPKPRFGWTARVIDREGGNGDGLVQRGERLSVEVTVTNLGRGAADDVLVTLENDSGESVFIEEGRATVGALGVGEDATVRFGLRIKETLRSQDVALEVNVVDQGLRTWASGPVTFEVFPPGFPKAARATGVTKVGVDPAQLFAGAHEDSGVIGTLAPGMPVAVSARCGGFFELWRAGEPRGSLGWVRASAVGELTAGEPDEAAAAEGLQWRRSHEPPALEVSLGGAAGGALVTSGTRITLEGTARFGRRDARGRRDITVYLDDDKVFYAAATAANTVNAGAEVEAFETALALEPGANRVTVVARDGDQGVTRERFVVFRTSGR